MTTPRIQFIGLVRDQLGIALWQADGSGAEPAAIGHTFNTPLYPITAHYYIASRDYVDANSRGGMRATALAGNWPQLSAALARHGKSAPDLALRLPLTTPGGDREGVDWSYQNGVETRHLYPRAPVSLLLGTIPLAVFNPQRLVLTEDYNGAETFADVNICLVSDSAPANRAAAPAGSTALDVATALLADIANRPVRFVVDTIRLAPDTFDGNGRVHGRYADIPQARLETL